MRYPIHPQYDEMDCGPTCLKMVASFYRKNYPLSFLRDISHLNRNGVNLLSLHDAAQSIGFKSVMAYMTLDGLIESFSAPCIIHWNNSHFVVLYRVSKRKYKEPVFTIGDPRHGLVKVDLNTFLEGWLTVKYKKGTVLLLEPTSKFFNNPSAVEDENLSFLYKYLTKYSKFIFQLFLWLLTINLISLAFPFLTQILVDSGIRDQNLSVVYLILFSQLFIFIGNTVISVLQSWLLLQISARISLDIISDFLKKLFDLPIKFFDSKSVGDITQRVADHNRVENFLTSTALNTAVSLLNVLVFSLVLGLYSLKILLVFAFFSFCAVAWIFLFQNKRKEIDYVRFNANKENQDKLYEIVVGMPEIKLYGGEISKRESWEGLQIKLFNLNVKSLSLEQFQRTGFFFLLQLKNILISYIAARGVISGDYSLGTMLGISYVIGQTNSPLEQLITFFRLAQDSRLSLNRMREIHSKENEEKIASTNIVDELKSAEGIIVKNVSFQYGGPKSKKVLNDVTASIPLGKVTAIVGTSGSGKTTLLKLLLKFYDVSSGRITINGQNLVNMSAKEWRQKCGTVMQDGHIFSDSILKNIALDGKEVDHSRLEEALFISNLRDFLDVMPSGIDTRIGPRGNGISGGQKQRLFIARAVYKNPDFLFFDEATSSLDANNEKLIMERLNDFFSKRTVVVIAHRLSTVKNADNIIVMQDGQIVESGNHYELLKLKGYYYELIKNQLELEK